MYSLCMRGVCGGRCSAERRVRCVEYAVTTVVDGIKGEEKKEDVLEKRV